MKKSLIALAVLAASGAAMAQSSVTLYGLLDVAYGQTKSTTAAGVATKTTGMFDGSANGIGDSRWGLRGSEDLGNGLRANFNLEQSLDVNNGGATTGFSRRSVVGLSGSFGAVDLGKEYTPIFSLASVVAVDGLSTAHKTNNLAGLTGDRTGRRSNSITYTSPSFAGVQVKVQAGQQKEETGSVTSNKTEGYGLSVAYANGPLVAGFAYDIQAKATAHSKDVAAWAIGGSYDLGAAKVYADYVNAEPNAVAAGVDKLKELNAGVRVPFGAASFIAGVGRNKQQNVGGTSLTGTDYVLGADYNLSKRTTTYARVSQSNKYGTAKNQGFAVGLRHAF